MPSVELRNSPEQEEPILYVKKRNSEGGDTIISGPGPIELETIQMEMDKVIKEEHGGLRGISLDTYLLLQLKGPGCEPLLMNDGLGKR